MQRALDAMINHHPASRMYHVMTSVMAYGGLRPSEVVMLRPRGLVLPASGWGAIEVTEADIGIDVAGDPKTGSRTVPIPANLVDVLRTWITAGGFEADDLIFRGRTGNRPSASNSASRFGGWRFRRWTAIRFGLTTVVTLPQPAGLPPGCLWVTQPDASDTPSRHWWRPTSVR